MSVGRCRNGLVKGLAVAGRVTGVGEGAGVEDGSGRQAEVELRAGAGCVGDGL